MADTGDGAGSQTIRIFLRARPVAKPSELVEVYEEDNKVEITVPKDTSGGAVNNQQECFIFRFDGVLPPASTQDEVFDTVAKDVVVSALDGINGTVFAYGSTGSGKTFTITGGVSKYADRGLIPRAMNLAFTSMAQNPDCTYEVYVSYLEIYNDTGYDLLDPSREAKRMEDLPRVSVYEDQDGATRLRNLALHPAATEEAALNLLFLGDTNRAISETPMNLASSRSHCIFTLHIAARQEGQDTVKRSKLHMVDLAGSERIKRTGMEGGTLLREAKHINLSLHFLEQVIVALQEKAKAGRVHVPYRNSMMTLVLRDSLGGNCRTVMVATVSPSADQLPESVATCRFAQRVALISNEVVVNEEQDPVLVVVRLKREVTDLKAELRLARGEDEEAEDESPEATNRRLAAVQQAVDTYFRDPDPAATFEVSPPRIGLVRAAFARLKSLSRWAGGSAGASMSHEAAKEIAQLRSEKQRLQQLVDQRDAEMGVLMSMLPNGASSPSMLEHVKSSATADSQPAAEPLARQQTEAIKPSALAHGGLSSVHAKGSIPEMRQMKSPDTGQQPSLSMHATTGSTPKQDDKAELQRAFDSFRQSYPGEAGMQTIKALLAARYSEAKLVANQVNECKQRIDELKTGIERSRLQKSIPRLGRMTISNSDFAVAEPDAQEQTAKQHIEEVKATYRDKYALLKNQKIEIEQLQLSLEAARRKVQEDFHLWMQTQAQARA